MGKKKLPAGDDVPGIYRKPKPIPLKRSDRPLTAAEKRAARKAFDAMVDAPPWLEWFATTLGDFLEVTATSDDNAIMRDAQYARHLWKWCRDSITDDPSSEKAIRNAFSLGELCQRIQVRPFDDDVRARRKQIRAIGGRNLQAPERTDLKKQEALAALESIKQVYPHRENDTDFLKIKAAESLGITKRALNSRLSK